jgi:predicted polyphosphate/ATP-dependent NAD kinase
MVADDAGRGIVALVQKAADLAREDCDRAMDLAHRLSSELRAAEERAREFEAEANYFRDRAARAEEWLVRIEGELQQTFFQNKEQQQYSVR